VRVVGFDTGIDNRNTNTFACSIGKRPTSLLQLKTAE